MKTTKSGDTIKDIVRRGQDTLCALGKQVSEYNEWRVSSLGPDYAGDGHAYYYNKPAHQNWATDRGVVVEESPGPTQSLGELCLEIAQDDILENSKNDYLAYVGKTVGYDWPIRGDIQQLKQAMYHRPRQIAGTPKGD